MPRGYSFEHFQVPKREPRERASPPDELKAATAHKGEELAESQEGLHYGRKNAETVKRLQARTQKRKPVKAPARGGKAVARAPAAAKKAVQRGARKAPARKTPARKTPKKR